MFAVFLLDKKNVWTKKCHDQAEVLKIWFHIICIIKTPTLQMTSLYLTNALIYRCTLMHVSVSLSCSLFLSFHAIALLNWRVPRITHTPSIKIMKTRTHRVRKNAFSFILQLILMTNKRFRLFDIRVHWIFNLLTKRSQKCKIFFNADESFTKKSNHQFVLKQGNKTNFTQQTRKCQLLNSYLKKQTNKLAVID